MLILSRMEGEKIMVGDNITLIVKQIGGRRGNERVVIAIDAPKDTPIRRGELEPKEPSR